MAEFFEKEKGVNLEQIQILETKYDLKFPIEYINHLLENNGGRCEPSIFEFDENGRKNKSIIDWFLAIYDGEYDNLEDYIITYKIEEKRLPNTFIPIAHDPGGNLICIDSSDSKIYFWNHENEIDYSISDDSIRTNIFFIANSLQEFISSLN